LEEIDFNDDDRARLSEEQERLRKRQQELERLRREKEINEAALKIQNAYRAYMDRKKVKKLESKVMNTGYFFKDFCYFSI